MARTEHGADGPTNGPTNGRTDGPPRPDPVEVRVYRFTGRLGPITVPERWCRECDLFVRIAEQAADQASVPAEVTVLSWWTRLLGALRVGGWHPPVLVVRGRRIAQGHDVPSVERVVEAIEAPADADGRSA